MPAHHRSPDRPSREPRSVTEAAVRDGRTAASADGASAGDGTAIDAAIERAELRARIRTLERELAASERHRRDLIEQYERLLAERDANAEAADGAGTHRSVLRGLLVPGR